MFFVKTSAPEPLPIKKIKEEPKQQRVVETKRPVAKQTYREEYKKIEPTIQLESYYYGILPKEINNDSGVPVSFNVKVEIDRGQRLLCCETSLTNSLFAVCTMFRV